MRIGESFVTVMDSVGGWMWVVMRQEEGYAEPYNTADLKRATREEAVEDAKIIARQLEIKHHEG